MNNLVLFVTTTARCKINGNSYPGIPAFFDGNGIVRHATDFMVDLVYAHRRPETTARTYAMHLQGFLKHLKAEGIAWDVVTDGDLIAWRSHLLTKARLAPGTVEAYLATVFRFYLWAQETSRLQYAVGIHREYEDASGVKQKPSYRISASESRRPGHLKWSYLNKVEGRALRHTPTSSEIERLHSAAFRTQTGQRDSLLMSFYEECYYRRFEALSLTVDYIPSWDEIEDALSKGTGFDRTIRGKGGFTRPFVVSADLMQQAREYIEGDREDTVGRARQRNPRYKEPKALFLAQTTGKPVTDNHISRRISKLMRSVDIENVSGHRLRAAGLTALCIAYDGVDESGRPFPAEQVLIKVAAAAGHRNIKSLVPYLALARASTHYSGTEERARDGACVRTLRRQIAVLNAELASLKGSRTSSTTRKRGNKRRS